MDRLFALLCALCAGAALSQPAATLPAAVEVSLEPKKAHEECMRLEAGEKRKYFWKSSAAVDFNIHFHRGEKVVFPVRRDGMRGDGGTFVARTGEDYCWMWTARNAPAKVEGRISR